MGFTAGNSYDCDAWVTIGKDDWAVEQALWMLWKHRGQLTAQSECEMISIDSAAFGQVVCHDLSVHMLCFLYARDYTSSMQVKRTKEVADVYPAAAIYEETVSFIVDFDQGYTDLGEGLHILIPSPVAGAFFMPGQVPSGRHLRQSLSNSLGLQSLELSWRRPMTSGAIL